MILDIVVCFLLLAGATLMLFAALGINIFRDALCRAHALTKASTMGICLMLLALWIALDDDVSGLKILLVMSFSLLTIPLAGHLIAMLIYQDYQYQKQEEEKDDDEI